MDNATENIGLKVALEIQQIFPDSQIINEENFDTESNNKPLFYVRKKSYITDSTCTINKSETFYKGIMIPKSEFQINLEKNKY